MYKNILILFLFCLLGCATPKADIDFSAGVNTEFVGKQTTMAKKYTGDRAKFNSVCQFYDIPSDIRLWVDAAYKDYETKQMIRQKVYLKNSQNGISTDVFRLNLDVAGKDTTFIVLYRKTTTN